MYLIFGNPVPVKHSEFKADFAESLATAGDLKDYGLVENGVESAFFHVRLPLGNALLVVQKVDFYVRIGEASNVHSGKVPSFQHHYSQLAGFWLPAQ